MTNPGFITNTRLGAELAGGCIQKSYGHRLEMQVCRLHNRVFHHERIAHWPDLPQRHEQILETVGWINPELKKLLSVMDRFPRTYRVGSAALGCELAQVLYENDYVI